MVFLSTPFLTKSRAFIRSRCFEVKDSLALAETFCSTGRMTHPRYNPADQGSISKKPRTERITNLQ